MFVAFFEGNPHEERGLVVMEETDESVKILKQKGLKIFSITKSFLNVKRINPWINDKLFYSNKKNSKRVRNKNTRALPYFKYGLTEMKINQLKKLRNLLRRKILDLSIKLRLSFQLIA